MNLKTVLTAVLAIWFNVVGLVKVGGGNVLPQIHNMEKHTIGDRLQPALASLLPQPNIAPKFRDMPVNRVLLIMGCIELSFGCTMLLSLYSSAQKKKNTNGLGETSIIFQLIYMIIQLLGHVYGDGVSLSVNDGPSGFVHTVVLASLLFMRSLMSPIKTQIKLK